MTVTAPMARDKKSEPPAPEPAGEEKKNVKVGREFHKRLKVVAAALGREMGEIVERELEDFLAREEAALRKPKSG